MSLGPLILKWRQRPLFLIKHELGGLGWTKGLLRLELKPSMDFYRQWALTHRKAKRLETGKPARASR